MGKPAMWTKHRPIALAIAPEWRIPHMDADDVRQEALLALWEACGDHDPAKGPFPPFARLVIGRRMRDILQAATRQKRTADFDHHAEPVGPDLETTIVHRDQLRLAFDDPILNQQRKWREAKRKQRAA